MTKKFFKWLIRYNIEHNKNAHICRPKDDYNYVYSGTPYHRQKWKHLHNIKSRVDKLWYILKVEYSIVMKMNELFQVTAWINLTMLKEGRQT